ncbi:alpha/beta hydrolase [Thermomonospora umbrina]|uniref:Acetyl esterase/lipase n=1 Tax=Thermomonospora umbrina TaxID=111806 RepID=A0A3D9SK26_9ACTN|nr:alpha/beta hydrolase [Thermomonospora umbrina]REE96057.1 acetyl esterase/lipase [Thermomonospora umbrina]
MAAKTPADAPAPDTATRTERRLAKVLALEPGGRPTPAARIAGGVIRVFGRSVWEWGPGGDTGLLLIQRLTERLGRLQAVPAGVVRSREDLGRPGGGTEWVRAGAPDERKVLLYLHGGGYFFGGPRLYRPFGWRLSAATGRPVLALDYRLAPQHTPADALDDAMEAYDFLLKRGYRARDIVVGGDSAGGHLTLALLQALKRQEKPLPSAAILISPWVDLMCTAESHTLNRRSDRLIPGSRLAWLGRGFCRDKDDDDLLLSPVRGDLSGLPPMLFMASTSEILRDDSREAAARARAAGVEVVHQEWEGLVHVWPVFSDFIPEGKAAFRHMADFLRRVEA